NAYGVYEHLTFPLMFKIFKPKGTLKPNDGLNERSQLETDPNLTDALKQITQSLTAWKSSNDLTSKNIEHLLIAINDRAQFLQAYSLTDKAIEKVEDRQTTEQKLFPSAFSDRLASAITHTVESLEVESLTDAIEQFSNYLKDYKGATENLNHLAATINQFEQSIIPNASKQTIKDALHAVADYLEQSTLENEPNFANSLEKLTQTIIDWKNLNTIAEKEKLQESITHYAQQLEPSPIVPPASGSMSGSMFDPTDNPTVTANNETRQIETNPSDEQVIISQRLELLSQQIETLQPKNSKQARERDFLERKIANLQAYSQLSPGQQVSKDEQTGIITELKITKGGMPEAWVKWENYPVPVPEQPERLQAVTPQQSSLLEQNDDSFYPQQRESTDGEDIGRRTVSRLNASSREIRRDRRQINRGETRSSTQSTDRTNEKTVERPATGLQQFSSNASHFKRGFESSDEEIRYSTSPTRQTDGKARPRVNLNVGRNSFNRRDVERTRERFRQDYQQRRELTQRIRSLPLEEVAERLGMERDRYDKHKWRSDGCIISINDGKFYDHLAQKGGGGAIDLVMHVREINFKEAVEWLNNGTIDLPPAHQHSPPRTEPIERPPFQAPILDETKWAAVKDYLVEKRGLSESLVEQLHQQGDLYADSKQNAVFLRKNLSGEITGASLRGTYKNSQFKGLATGTRREGGWFRVTKGEGQPERIVLTESPIDTLSAAAIAQKPETTLFISTDGAGCIPSGWLQQQLSQGKQVLVAYDADEAGERMAQQVIEQLPGAQRIKPTVGKDWNEQLVHTKGVIEKQKQSYRHEYLQLQNQVRSNSSFETASTEKTDIAIAMLILKQDKQANLNRVGQVLSQSDRVRDWKRSLSEGEYKTKAKDYITKTYEQASQLRQEIISKKPKKCDLELS
ncbi:MAG: DUF3991 domain-containing protein, partial [Hydrococcus sp. RU_2_2]|nr:DUF3991 domain-containing protein [Hydrococcus sp. RU_2_2]